MDTEDFFSKYKDEKIALYGLGTETLKVLDNLQMKYKIIGLLDGFRQNGEVYGRPIISFDDAVKEDVRLIIVVARPGSCRAITKRIGQVCKKNNICLMDVRGKDLLAENKVIYDLKMINGITKKELACKIQNADVVSFDLFDTLVMRQTPDAEDVLVHLESRLQEKGIIIRNFVVNRLESEKELSRSSAPTLFEIYQEVLSKLKDSTVVKVTAEYLAQLEWEIDFSLLIPRRDVCDIFNQTVKSGKSVYIVSDTYYNKEQLTKILEKCGVVGYKDILSSSDYGTGKQQNLYTVLKEKEKEKKYLHVGDDIVADVENARLHGIEACRVMSGAELLETVGTFGFINYMDTVSERLKIGIFIAKVFNSPFQFEDMERQIVISNAYDLGYLIFAPMISDFVIWFLEQIKKQNFRNIWFCSRDGYLIEKMYEYLTKENGEKTETLYFLTSRMAAIRAGIKDEKDILYVDSMKYSGTMEENLKDRFEIDVNDVAVEDIAENETGLMRYKKIIMEKAAVEYKRYKKYIGNLNIYNGNIAFFDFVAKGTSQMYIQRLVPNRLKGFYFLQLETEFMKDKNLDICSFYTEENDKICAIFEEYYILETFLTAPFPSVTGFDDNGRPVYTMETRKSSDIECLQRIQEGILDYFKTYINLYPKRQKIISKKLDEILLGMVHKLKITDTDFLNMVVEDPFFNRKTDIADVL